MCPHTLNNSLYWWTGPIFLRCSSRWRWFRTSSVDSIFRSSASQIVRPHSSQNGCRRLLPWWWFGYYFRDILSIGIVCHSFRLFLASWWFSNHCVLYDLKKYLHARKTDRLSSGLLVSRSCTILLLPVLGTIPVLLFYYYSYYYTQLDIDDKTITTTQQNKPTWLRDTWA